MKGLADGTRSQMKGKIPIKIPTSDVTILYGLCVLTKVQYMKLSNPWPWSLSFSMAGNTSAELPPKFLESKKRPTKSPLISSSRVIGKISSPILDSLVKTETLSKDFFSFFKLVCRRGRTG